MKKLFPIIAIALLILLCGNINSVFAQKHIVYGTVYDAAQRKPIPFTQIMSPSLSEPAQADVDGNFEIVVNGDSCELTFFYTTYKMETKTVYFSKKEPKVKLVVKMISEIYDVEGASIVAKKIDNDPATSTGSIVNVNPKDMQNLNPTGVNEMVNKVPGVAVVDNEPQIRGGSGFSSGMGSRVLILLDDMPFLRPDAGRPMWSFIPMENIGAIEIYKGASSVLFGSSALTGAINAQTAYPGLDPTTKVNVHYGLYDSPRNKEEKSWGKVPPMKWGASFLHSRIIKNDFDLIVGGEYFDDMSYIGPERPISADSVLKTKYHDGKYEMRARLNFGMRYRPNKVKGLFASLNGNFMYSENAQSFFWYDSEQNKYRTYKGSLSVFKDFMFYLDPCLSYVGKDGSYYSLKNRITYSDNKEITGAQSARSMMAYDEFQYTKDWKFTALNFALTAGVMNLYTRSFGRVFSGNNYDTLPALMTSDNFAAYVQVENKFLKNRNLSLVLGARWEAFVIDHEFAQKPIFRIGLNYQLLEWHTAFRASFGQGYRYPSIGERYISISVGNYGFYPNPTLKPESSWNAEFGIAQPFRVGPFGGYFDVAAYHQQFDNFIEFAFGNWGSKGNFLDDMGFMYLNTGPASITGVDLSLIGMGKISPKVEFNFLFGYTYSYPITKNRKKIYYMTSDSTGYSYMTTASNPKKGILKYRIQHNFKCDLGFTFFKKLGVNIGMTYYSAMKNVDGMFFDFDAKNPNLSPAAASFISTLGTLPFTGFSDYFYAHQKGSFCLDVGISYNILEDLKVSFIVKNILNNEYTLRPMYLEAPRTFNFQLVYGL